MMETERGTLCTFTMHGFSAQEECGRKIRLDGTEFVGTWDVEVDGQSAPFVETVYEPCVQTTVGDDSTWSWGTMKALYR